MRIGIDCRMITHPGIGRYIRNLIHHLLLFDSKNQYVLYAPYNFLDDSVKDKAEIKIVNYPIYSVVEQVMMPLHMKGLDIFHATHYNAPIFPLYKNKMVVTIHDLIHLLFPDYLPNRFALGYAKYMLSQSAKNAAKIIAVSQNTKNDIMKLLNVDSEKIQVVYEATSMKFKKVGQSDVSKKIAKKYNLPKKYILYVGSMRYHKNVIRLINAFIQLCEEKSIEEKLVLGGRFDKKATKIQKLFQNPSVKKYVQYIGEIDAQDLTTLYSMAEVFVFPSLYEGFGLPPLEALACDTIVCSSNAGSIPEVLGDAAAYFDPYSEEDIKKVLGNVLLDENVRAELAIKGRAQKNVFSWEKTAEQTLEVYERTFKNRGKGKKV